MTVLLAHTYDGIADPTGYFLSEKLDGIRCKWDGNHLCSRTGNIFDAPKWFTEKFTSTPMDGELFLGRKMFDTTSSIVSNGAKDNRWCQLKYIVFDIPDRDAGPVEKRWERLRNIVNDTGVKHLQYMPQSVCTGRDQLTAILELVIKQGGEGVMLRAPRSTYCIGRSNSLLKYKKFFDAEATVTGHIPLNSGGREMVGVMGACECITDDGVKLKVGTGFSQAEREDPPPKGCRITYRYQELTKDGKPRFPSFIRIRKPE